MIRSALALAVLTATTAAAAAPSDEPTAADVAHAPAAGEESGRVDVAPDDAVLRTVARGALLVPRAAVRLVLAPAELGIWTYERFQLRERVRRLFFNARGTAGVFPIASVASGFGVNVGARAVHRDLFGAGGKASASAATGGRYRQIYALAFESGTLLGERVTLELDGEYERRPKDPYFGVGNGDGMEARFRHRLARVTAVADLRVTSALRVRAAGVLADHAFGRSDTGVAIDDVYRLEQLPGFAGYRAAYGEAELRWDGRRAGHAWEPAAITSAGTLAAVFGGRSLGIAGAPADFVRAGFDLQHFVRVGEGPRVFSIRAHGEVVTGVAGDVPFGELPRLGGRRLRGYPADRFRDRVVLVGALDYRWDLARTLSATVFVDAGRVYRALDDVALDGIRLGYGVGLELYTERSFLARASIASSIDGGVFFDVSLDPVFELDRRVTRR